MQPNVMPGKSLRWLVNSEVADRFLTLAATPTGAKALVGDGEVFTDSAARGALINAATALRDGVAVIEKLALDKTRLPPSQHAAAQRVANGVITTLANAKATAVNRATELHQSAHEEADAEFGPKYNRGSLESEIRTWVRTEAAKPDGIGKVREALTTNRDVANVIWHSPSFLVGLNESLHAEYRYTVMEAFLPTAYAKVNESVALEKIGPKLDAAISGVRQTFYSPGIAAEAATRVEV